MASGILGLPPQLSKRWTRLTEMSGLWNTCKALLDEFAEHPIYNRPPTTVTFCMCMHACMCVYVCTRETLEYMHIII